MQILLRALLLAMLMAGCQLAPNQPVARTPTPEPPPATPALQPTALPPPAQLDLGLGSRALGEHDAAAEQFYALVQAYPNDPRAPEAAFYLAESFVLRERWPSAIAALEPIASAEPPGPFGARALLLLARAYERSGDHSRAADTYARYAALKTTIAPYAQLRQGEQLLALGRPAEAAAVFEAAGASEIVSGERAFAYERAAVAWLASSQPAEAVRAYLALLELAEAPSYRARMLLEAAGAAQQAGDGARQLAWLTELAEGLPATPQAAAAADQLQASPGALDPALAAFIYESAERYDDARAQYDAAIALASGEPRLDLIRRRALTLRVGPAPDYAAALAALDEVLAAANPQGDLGRQARLDRIQTVGQAGDIAGAAAAYRAYAAELPDDPRAPLALSRAAILQDRLGQPAAAAELRIELATGYPDTQLGQDALFPAGRGFYQAGRLDDAARAWELLADRGQGAAADQGAYWAARARREQGDQAAATALLERAAGSGLETYYATRAAAELGRQTRGALPIDAPIRTEDWPALDTWIAGWAPVTAGEQPAPPHGPAARAIALDEVALWDEARAEWRAALQGAAKDPQQLRLLARQAHEHGRPGMAMQAAERLDSLAPPEARTAAPLILQRLRYPTPYPDAVRSAAAEHGVDPLVLYALMRQESGFDPQITSSAGARGLAQVMPDTGRGIAQALGEAEFSEGALYRPGLSIRFGAFYLANQISRSDGHLHVALSGYNGGPGNADRWAEATSPADQDLFVESIDFAETRSYVKIVSTNYAIYQQLYSNPI